MIENAFGILASRWRIFHTPINATIENTERYIRAAVVLHNYLRQTENSLYCPSGFVDTEEANGDVQPGHWRELTGNDENLLLKKLPNVRGSRYKEGAVKMRDALKDCINSATGSLRWQLDYVRRT